jgi:hypothetical protein
VRRFSRYAKSNTTCGNFHLVKWQGLTRTIFNLLFANIVLLLYICNTFPVFTYFFYLCQLMFELFHHHQIRNHHNILLENFLHKLLQYASTLLFLDFRLFWVPGLGLKGPEFKLPWRNGRNHVQLQMPKLVGCIEDLRTKREEVNQTTARRSGERKDRRKII